MGTDLGFCTLLLITALVAWWLSGYDAKVTGENKSADLKRRAARCGVTLLLVAAALGASAGSPRFGGFVFLGMVLPLGIFWAGCLSEVFTRMFHGLIDSADHTQRDPTKHTRDLDRLAALVEEGRSGEAIELSTALLKTGESSMLAIETLLFRLYDEMFSDQRAPNSAALAEADQLYREGHWAEAEAQFNQLLKREPLNLPTTIALLRFYSRDLRSSLRAQQLLKFLEDKSDLAPGFLEYARRQSDLWLRAVPQTKSAEGIESLLVHRKHSQDPAPLPDPKEATVSSLLADGCFGTAIEVLETRVREQPQDFESWLILAEAHGVYCGNLGRAGKIIGRMELNKQFSPAQIQIARAKLQEWRARKSRAGGI